MKAILRPAVLLITLLMASFTACGATNMTIKMTGLDGKQHSLDEYIGKGKWVIVNFWGTACPPCVEEIPELIGFHDANSKHTAMVVGVAVDFPSFGLADKDGVRTFVDDNLVSYPILLGSGDIIKSITGDTLWGIPASYVYQPDGKIAIKHVGTLTQDMLEKFIANYKPK